MAKRFIKPSINWVELEKKVPREQRNNFIAFKGKADAYLRRVLEHPAEPPKINWEEYKKSVPVKDLVDKMKSAYESYKVPYPEDTLSAKVDEQWKSLEPQIKAFCADLQKQIDVANKEVARIKALPKFEDMTLEMACEMYPETAFDPVNKPTFWPHNDEEQLWYKPPEQQQTAKH